MAMSKSRLKAALFARLKPHYRNEAPSNKAQDADYWLDKFCEILSDEVIDEIVNFAKCSGADSDGDTHDNVGIV